MRSNRIAFGEHPFLFMPSFPFDTYQWIQSCSNRFVPIFILFEMKDGGSYRFSHQLFTRFFTENFHTVHATKFGISAISPGARFDASCRTIATIWKWGHLLSAVFVNHSNTNCLCQRSARHIDLCRSKHLTQRMIDRRADPQFHIIVSIKNMTTYL